MPGRRRFHLQWIGNVCEAAPDPSSCRTALPNRGKMSSCGSRGRSGGPPLLAREKLRTCLHARSQRNLGQRLGGLDHGSAVAFGGAAALNFFFGVPEKQTGEFGSVFRLGNRICPLAIGGDGLEPGECLRMQPRCPRFRQRGHEDDHACHQDGRKTSFHVLPPRQKTSVELRRRVFAPRFFTTRMVRAAECRRVDLAQARGQN